MNLNRGKLVEFPARLNWPITLKHFKVTWYTKKPFGNICQIVFRPNRGKNSKLFRKFYNSRSRRKFVRLQKHNEKKWRDKIMQAILFMSNVNNNHMFITNNYKSKGFEIVSVFVMRIWGNEHKYNWFLCVYFPNVWFDFFFCLMKKLFAMSVVCYFTLKFLDLVLSS